MRLLLLILLAAFPLIGWTQQDYASGPLGGLKLTPDQSAMVARAKDAVAQRKWAEAAKLHVILQAQLFSSDTPLSGGKKDRAVDHLAGIGWLHLLNVDAAGARKYLDAALGIVGSPEKSYGVLRFGMERLAEMEGDYDEALKWRNLPIEFDPHCAFGAKLLSEYQEAAKFVWRKANGPNAKAKLAGIVSGYGLPVDVDEPSLIESYKGKASLLLAELNYREGNKAEAIKLFREIFFKPNGEELNEILARSYLDKLYGRK